MSKCIKCGNEILTGDIHWEMGLCNNCYNELYKVADLEAKLAESEKKIEELKGERLKFYNDDVRRTQVINGVHFDIEQLLVFSEYVEHEKWVISNRDKEIEKLKQQLADMHKKAVALFGVLYEILEKEDPENVSSKIDYLTKHNNSAISDQYKLERILKGGK